MKHVDLGIPHDHAQAIVDRLQFVLADEYVLFTKLFKYHWNVVGPHFGPLHKLFQEQYEELFSIIDEVAERTRQLGGISIGTLSEFSRYARLPEEPGENPEAKKMVSMLVVGYESIIKNLRKDIAYAEDVQDFGTVDFLTEVMQKHEKAAWFLRVHLEK